MAEVTVQSSSGGLFEGDHVFQRFVTGPHARATLGTAAATIVHTMTRGVAHSRVALEAQADSRLDYLPQPSILFPAARLVSTIDVVLHRGATVIVSDTWLTHDPTHRSARFGLLDATLSVRDADSRLMARDRFRLEPAAPPAALSGVQQPYAAHGGLLVLRRDDTHADGEALARAINAALGALDAPLTTAYAAAGALPNACGTFVRMLAADSLTLRTLLAVAVETVHRTLDGFHEGAPCASPCPPNQN